ncbi:MAG: hypothetical protein JSV00_05185 [bacterium]|nr:MAG: hypothetical protein JSV00_05185 [bacterium]
MKKILLPLALTAAVSLAAAAAVLAQGRTADLVGYEKAHFVTGKISISDDGSSVMVSDLKSSYARTLQIYFSRAFDQGTAVMIGTLTPDMPGDMTFDAPAPDMGDVDTVLVMVPGWSVPVGVGLLK